GIVECAVSIESSDSNIHEFAVTCSSLAHHDDLAIGLHDDSVALRAAVANTKQHAAAIAKGLIERAVAVAPCDQQSHGKVIVNLRPGNDDPAIRLKSY